MCWKEQGRKPQQMWSAQAKKNYLMLLSHSTKCTHEIFPSHRWSTTATSTLQDPLTTLSGWPCYPGGFKLEQSIKNNKLSSLHLTELLLASSLNQMERILLQSQSAASLPNFKQFNSSFLLENSGISFPTQWDVSCPASVSLRSSLCMYGFPRSFYSQTAEILPLPAHTKCKTFYLPSSLIHLCVPLSVYGGPCLLFITYCRLGSDSHY